MADQVWGNREDLYSVSVKVIGTDGKIFRATFDTFEGGDAPAKNIKYRPGNGTKNEVDLGGPVSVSNITVGCLLSYGIYQWVPWLLAQSGKAAMITTKQPLDTNGRAYGSPLVYGSGKPTDGRLINVAPPKTSSESDVASVLVLTQSATTPITSG